MIIWCYERMRLMIHDRYWPQVPTTTLRDVMMMELVNYVPVALIPLIIGYGEETPVYVCDSYRSTIWLLQSRTLRPRPALATYHQWSPVDDDEGKWRHHQWLKAGELLDTRIQLHGSAAWSLDGDIYIYGTRVINPTWSPPVKQRHLRDTLVTRHAGGGCMIILPYVALYHGHMMNTQHGDSKRSTQIDDHVSHYEYGNDPLDVMINPIYHAMYIRAESRLYLIGNTIHSSHSSRIRSSVIIVHCYV
jgi:hypothetical protein